MKPIAVCLLATAALLLVSSKISRADEFTQVQNNPKTYWVPAPSDQGQAQGQSQAQAQAPAQSEPVDPKSINQPPPQGYASAPPQGYYYGPPPGYYPPPGYVVAPPPPGYYYGPRPYYYGPPVAAGYYGGPHGSRVFIGIPGLFLGFHFH
jgi:hypothetical protein